VHDDSSRLTDSPDRSRPPSEEVPLYASAYAGFDARDQVRRETYGNDVGQSGWTTTDELDHFAELLGLGAQSHLLDVGCGSGGPALYLSEKTGAHVLGVDALEEGISTATRLAQERGLVDHARFVQIDATEALPFADDSFDAVISIDAMCHLPNRLAVLSEWHRVTSSGARVLFTDPTIVTGLVTAAEIAVRSAIGFYVFSAESVNERLLAEAGFDLLNRLDVTENMAEVAGRWRDARARFRDELVADEGNETFEGVQKFLETCTLLARERRLTRQAYLAKRS
jgi:ubiquinone/menaquinone biosynthesis C-methylase UbiE